MKKIAVIGSINMDYFIESDILPEVGETVLGKDFFLSIGGKGANQVVAAARLGGEVSLFGSLGSDENSEIIVKKLGKENINLEHLQIVEDQPTGAAFIELCNSDNRILVVPGSNQSTNKAYVKDKLSEILQHDVFVFQLETPLKMLEYLIPILHEQEKTIILNPAPAQSLSQELIEKITYLTPNQHEYRIIFSTEASMEQILRQFPNKLIVTCGAEGVRFYDGKDIVLVPSLKVTPVDTTGAGDTFSGAFSVGIAEGKSVLESIQFGTIAAGLSVTKKGAQTGMPHRSEVAHFEKREQAHESEGHTQTN